MVIHQEKPLPIKETICLESKTPDINNHVDQPQSKNVLKQNSMNNSSERKKRKQDKASANNYSSCSENSESGNVNHISRKDLEELRSVYQKCKDVMRKIESKYGNLLNLEESNCKKRKKFNEESEDSEECKCECATNKKNIFDDDGKEMTIDTALENHICPKKKKIDSYVSSVNNLKIEYENEGPNLSLPDNLTSLSHILQDSSIETTYRNKVVHKMKLMKQEYTDEIKFNKRSLIEKVKSNAEELFEFKGSNLNKLPGYLY